MVVKLNYKSNHIQNHHLLICNRQKRKKNLVILVYKKMHSKFIDIQDGKYYKPIDNIK